MMMFILFFSLNKKFSFFYTYIPHQNNDKFCVCFQNEMKWKYFVPISLCLVYFSTNLICLLVAHPMIFDFEKFNFFFWTKKTFKDSFSMWILKEFFFSFFWILARALKFSQIFFCFSSVSRNILSRQQFLPENILFLQNNKSVQSMLCVFLLVCFCFESSFSIHHPKINCMFFVTKKLFHQTKKTSNFFISNIIDKRHLWIEHSETFEFFFFGKTFEFLFWLNSKKQNKTRKILWKFYPVFWFWFPESKILSW